MQCGHPNTSRTRSYCPGKKAKASKAKSKVKSKAKSSKAAKSTQLTMQPPTRSTLPPTHSPTRQSARLLARSLSRPPTSPPTRPPPSSTPSARLTAPTACTVSTRQQRKRKELSARRNKNKALYTTGTSRLVNSKFCIQNIGTEGRTCLVQDTEERTCLVQSLWSILPSKYTTPLLLSTLLAVIPNEGKPTIKHMNGVLAKHGMKLERITDEYRKKGGMKFFLLQEKECSLIINVKLANHEGHCWRHFIAWDGNVVYYSPKDCKVNGNSDRTPEGSMAVFERLFCEEEFSSHSVASVFKLQPCPLHDTSRRDTVQVGCLESWR